MPVKLRARSLAAFVIAALHCRRVRPVVGVSDRWRAAHTRRQTRPDSAAPPDAPTASRT